MHACKPQAVLNARSEEAARCTLGTHYDDDERASCAALRGCSATGGEGSCTLQMASGLARKCASGSECLLPVHTHGIHPLPSGLRYIHERRDNGARTTVPAWMRLQGHGVRGPRTVAEGARTR